MAAKLSLGSYLKRVTEYPKFETMQVHAVHLNKTDTYVFVESEDTTGLKHKAIFLNYVMVPLESIPSPSVRNELIRIGARTGIPQIKLAALLEVSPATVSLVCKQDK